MKIAICTAFIFLSALSTSCRPRISQSDTKSETVHYPASLTGIFSLAQIEATLNEGKVISKYVDSSDLSGVQGDPDFFEMGRFDLAATKRVFIECDPNQLKANLEQGLSVVKSRDKKTEIISQENGSSVKLEFPEIAISKSNDNEPYFRNISVALKVEMPSAISTVYVEEIIVGRFVEKDGRIELDAYNNGPIKVAPSYYSSFVTIMNSQELHFKMTLIPYTDAKHKGVFAYTRLYMPLMDFNIPIYGSMKPFLLSSMRSANMPTMLDKIFSNLELTLVGRGST